jgi:uncharacterized protein (DUF433 family)
MTDKTNNNTTHTAPGKKPLDPHLFSGSKGTVDAVRVQTGYPIWNLIAAWIASGYDDPDVLDGYSPMTAEAWEAAKRYYADHKTIIDARIIANSQPGAEDDVPPMQTVEEFYSWLMRDSDRDASQGTNTHG